MSSLRCHSFHLFILSPHHTFLIFFIDQGDSFIESDEDSDGNNHICDTKHPDEHIDVKDIEVIDDEEIEEELEFGNESMDTSESKLFENIPCLGSNVTSENLGGRKERSRNIKLMHQAKTNEDTIVLTFSSSKENNLK